MQPDLARFTGRVFRAHHPMWAGDALSGMGAARQGGRFNRVGTPALYTSCDPMTALAEAQQAFPFKPQPMTLVAYDVDCERMADLTRSPVLEVLGIAQADLACGWESLADLGVTPPTWKLADRLIGESVSGVVAPSYAPGVGADATNAVFWRTQDTCRVEVIDDFRRLAPRLDTSNITCPAESR